MQELPAEEKEGYLTRATLLMHNQPMVSIVVVMDVFFFTNAHSQEEEENASSAKQ